MDLHRIERTLKTFNRIGYSKNGMNRLAYTEEELKAKNLFIKICKDEGMKVRMDACGNVIARREGTHSELPPVMIGSHMDTVYDGGQYDGAVGVVVGIELIRNLNDRKIQTKHPIEVICFTAEESSRFGVATIGSKAMAGKLNTEKVADLKDHDGVTLKEAFTQMDLNFKEVESVSRRNENLKAFFEVHIEQGPVLEKEKKKIGIVTGIAAPTRIKVTLEGKASHSGTTPMNLRRDAFLGAAEIGLIVEQAAKSEASHGTVATVGDCTIEPGAMNVVPGKAEMKIDIRGIESASKQRVLAKVMDGLRELEKRRKLVVHSEMLVDDEPVLLEEEVVSSISETCEQSGISNLKMPSGAGHDAMNMAPLCPTGLIFIPCKDGLSHHKDEFASLYDIGVGAYLLEKEVLKWAIPSNHSINEMDMGGVLHESL